MGELYDWKADPEETHDLASEQVELAGSMRSELFAFYLDWRARAKQMSRPAQVNLSPSRIHELAASAYIR